MRLAVMIIALCLTMILGLQSCAINFGGAVLANEATKTAGAIGILLAFIFVLGAALVMHFPRTAGILFLAGGGIALSAGLGSLYKDLAVWGIVSLVLALMAFIGSRERRRQQQPQTVVVVAPPYLQHPGMHPPSLPPVATRLTPVIEHTTVPTLPIEPKEARSSFAATLAIVIGIGVVVGVLATWFVVADRTAPQAVTVEKQAAEAAGADGETDSAPAPNTATPSSTDATAAVEAASPLDDAATAPDSITSHATTITRAWLVGTWGPLSAGDGDRRGACETDNTVTFTAAGTYHDGGSRGRFTTDGRSITYSGRILVDEADGTEDRSQVDTPEISPVMAIDADTMHESGETFVRCRAG